MGVPYLISRCRKISHLQSSGTPPCNFERRGNPTKTKGEQSIRGVPNPEISRLIVSDDLVGAQNLDKEVG